MTWDGPCKVHNTQCFIEMSYYHHWDPSFSFAHCCLPSPSAAWLMQGSSKHLLSGWWVALFGYVWLSYNHCPIIPAGWAFLSKGESTERTLLSASMLGLHSLSGTGPHSRTQEVWLLVSDLPLNICAPLGRSPDKLSGLQLSDVQKDGLDQMTSKTTSNLDTFFLF